MFRIRTQRRLAEFQIQIKNVRETANECIGSEWIN